MTVCPHCGQESPTSGPVCPLCRGNLNGSTGRPEASPEGETAPDRPDPHDGSSVCVYTHPVLANVAIVQTALESEGIASEIRGAYGRRMTHHATDVELWLADTSQEARAREIVQGTNQIPGALPSWTCDACGEDVEGHYAQCWQCGAEGPA